MQTNCLKVLALLIIFCTQAAAQDALPEKMEGRWFNPNSGHSNKVEVEVMNMESPTTATIKIAFWPYCRLTDSNAEFIDGMWVLTAKRCNTPGANEIKLRVRPIVGKKRLEGFYGADKERTVFFEWD